MQGLYSQRNVHFLKFKTKKRVGRFSFFILFFLNLPLIVGWSQHLETVDNGHLYAFAPFPLDASLEALPKEAAAMACTITGITHTLTSCDPDNNTYSISGNVTFIDKPSAGLFVVEVDGSIFDVSHTNTFSPRFFVINNLVSDGAIKTITAYFTANPSCTFSVNYTAPASCNNDLQTTLCSGSDLELSCEGGSCPSPYPDVAPNTAYTGVDNNYAVFIGGDLNITGGRELEGRGFVYGDFNFNASGSNYNTGAVGVGTGVAPVDNTYWLTIGGDLNFNGTYLLAALGTTAEGLVAVKGTASDNDFANGANGQLVRSPNLDLSVFDACFTAVNTQSQCWATQSSSANGTYSNSFGTFTFSSTNGASGLYVFNITADMNPGYGGTANFQNFPNDATILINVDKPGASDNITLNIGAFSNVSDELRQRIIWNFPDASVVTLRGWSQFLGSIVVPSRTSLLDMVEVPGFNGRIIAGGDVTQVSSGSEFHNYSFEGDLSALPCSVSPSCSLASAGETLETCNNNSTTSDPSDDYITFSLNPTGANLGATYSVTANNGGTVTLAAGGSATGISYGSGTAFRLQNGSADGSTTFTIRVTDVADGTCQATTTVMQNSCSASCNISSIGETLETCNNNSTTSDPSDDYITFSLNPTGANLGATYSVTANNGGTVTLAAGGSATGISYGSATAFRLQNGSADGSTTFTIRVTDVADGICQATTTVMQNSCSASCNISSIGKTLETCNNNSTTSDPSDDYITFSLNPTGANLGATYSVIANNGGTVSLAGGGATMGVSYGSATAFRLQNGSANGSTNYTITLTDVSDGNCTVTTTVMESSCSTTCNLTSAGETLETCNPNDTNSNSSDDYITFSLNPTGSNLGATYSVTANNGGTVSLADGGAAMGVNYGSATAFRLQNGSANGSTNYTITLTDVSDGNCTVTTTVMQASCSLCVGATTYNVCSNGTNSITLTADAGYTNYQWFNEAGTLPSETNQSLMITGLTNGLGDGMEEFYYTALDGAGCLITLCCPAIVITENCLIDWGDLPDISPSTNANDYQTSNANNGPRHRIITGLHLGTTVDSEADGQASADALGDGADEDGITIFANLDLYPNMNFRLPFNYVNTTGDTAHVEAWIDWNGDGDFDEPNEMVADWEDSTTTFPDRLEVSIPATAQTGTLLGYRIRISNQDNMTPYGLQPNGEVEDYLIEIDCSQVCLPVQVNIIKK